MNKTVCLCFVVNAAVINDLSLQPVVGVVYNFIKDQMFSALVGKGAFMNNKPIHVSSCKGRQILV